jgi:type IV pilus assembly protein PilC
MPVFAYAGKARGGKSVTAEITADNRDTAIDQLRSQGVTVTTIEEKKKKAIEKKQAVTDKDIVVFTRQFATMIGAGLPLVQCLEILSSQCDNKTFGKLIGEVKMDVESGTTFAEALKKHPKVFSGLYCNMVQAGEVGGALDGTLIRLAAQLEKAAKLKAQIKTAMVYPTAILGVAIIVVSVLLVFVIPIFAKMFMDFGGTLPAPTLFVMGVSEFMQSYILFIIAGAVGAYYALKWYYATPPGRLQIDTLMLKLPVAGDLIRKIAVAQFTRTFGTLLQSGVPIME